MSFVSKGRGIFDGIIMSMRIKMYVRAKPELIGFSEHRSKSRIFQQLYLSALLLLFVEQNNDKSS